MKRVGAILAGALSIAAAEPRLVPDVSQRDIEIAYSFTGADLLLFGAIVHPTGRVPDGRTDIAVVLRGPARPIVVREKAKLGGLIWANADSMRFESAPDYYAVAASRPLDRLLDERTAAIYELGLPNIHLSPASGADAQATRRFVDGLIGLRQRTALFSASSGSVEITDGVLYRARIAIPARVTVGRYTAETFLIRNGKVIAVAARDVEIRKSGFERYVANAAVTHPFAYGLAAVGLSLLLGWAGAAAFRTR